MWWSIQYLHAIESEDEEDDYVICLKEHQIILQARRNLRNFRKCKLGFVTEVGPRSHGLQGQLFFPPFVEHFSDSTSGSISQALGSSVVELIHLCVVVLWSDRDGTTLQKNHASSPTNPFRNLTSAGNRGRVSAKHVISNLQHGSIRQNEVCSIRTGHTHARTHHAHAHATRTRTHTHTARTRTRTHARTRHAHTTHTQRTMSHAHLLHSHHLHGHNLTHNMHIFIRDHS